MESLKELFKVGPGPSSSHTIGPSLACKDFIKDVEQGTRIIVTLYGSLALTGKGHSTDKIILKTLEGYRAHVVFDLSENEFKHPNVMKIEAIKDHQTIKSQIYYSIGGGKIVKSLDEKPVDVFPLNSITEIKEYIAKEKIDFAQYVDRFEEKDINDYFENLLKVMFNVVENNLKKEGVLPGRLNLKRVAKSIYESALKLDEVEKPTMLMSSFAYAAMEGNACGDTVVTAPTCGSSGIIPALVYYFSKYEGVSDEKLVDALKAAGLFGNVCKYNASISGAVSGCQAEVGVASSMGAAFLSYICGLSSDQIEYAAEVALEHFLGLTCDPVDGYVLIPCIERNAIGALRSYEGYIFAKNIAPLRKNAVSFDKVVLAMKMTGDSLNEDYKETAKGGLAKVI